MKTYLLVGTHFHRPAKVLLAALVQDQEVKLVREPENPYDAEAVAVYVEQASLDMGLLEQLVDELEASGYTLRDVVRQPKWKLGHLAAAGGKPLAKATRESGLDLRSNIELLANYQERELPSARCHQGMDGLVTLQVGEEK